MSCKYLKCLDEISLISDFDQSRNDRAYPFKAYTHLIS